MGSANGLFFSITFFPLFDLSFKSTPMSSLKTACLISLLFWIIADNTELPSESVELGSAPISIISSTNSLLELQFRAAYIKGGVPESSSAFISIFFAISSLRILLKLSLSIPLQFFARMWKQFCPSSFVVWKR